MTVRRSTGQIVYGRSRDVTHLRGYIDGLTLSNDDAAPGDDVNIAAGICRDSTDVRTFSITDLTKQMDAVWNIGDDAGGRASGVAYAAGLWAVIVIANPSTLAVDAGFDTDPDGANLIADHSGSGGGDASGYTLYRRIGWIWVNATPKVFAFTQFGDLFLVSDPPLDVDIDVDGGSTASTPAISAPPDSWALVNMGAKDSWAAVPGTNTFCYVSATYQNDETPSETAAPLSSIDMNSESMQGWVFTNASRQIRVLGDDVIGNNDFGFRLATLAYIDSRGRDA